MGRALSLLVMSVTLVAGTVSAQLGTAATSLTIGQTIRQLEDAATKIIDRAGAEAQLTVMEAGQAALAATGALRAAYQDSLDKTLAGLTEQQRKAFERVRDLIAESESAARRTTTELQKLTIDLNAAVGNLPFGKRTPYVRTVSPTYFVLEPDRPLRIRVEGQNLSADTPLLKTAAQTLEPTQESDTELVFLFPPVNRSVVDEATHKLEEQLAAPASADNPTLPKPSITSQVALGELVVFEKRGGILGYFATIVPHTYKVAFFPVPPFVGTYEVLAKRRVQTEETANRRTPSAKCTSPHGNGRSEVPVSAAATATPGDSPWGIDTGSVHFETEYNNHGDVSIRSASPGGFTGVLGCEGFGRVEGPFGAVIDAGSQGVMQGYFAYVERRVVRGDAVESLKKGLLRWGESVPLPSLPPDTATIILNLTPFTGRFLALQGQSQTS